MVADRRSFALRARWIIPVEGPPIRDGMVVVHDGRIQHAGSAAAGDTGSQWLDAAILPSFVNPHTHLEFSSLQKPLGTPAMPFTDWIRRVMAWRQARDASAAGSFINAAYLAAVRQGIQESLQAGVGTLGEIASLTLSREALHSSGASGVTFLELIGLAESNIGPLVATARAFVSQKATWPSKNCCGISPHAPYTVHPGLVSAIAELSAAQQLPVAMHLAETEAELQLLHSRTGPFVDLLAEKNAWHPESLQLASRPLDYLKLLSNAARALAVHGNYLDDEEIGFLGEHRERMSVVYCPRTHHYFGHPPYPMQKLLAAGARVVLGTDSRGSTPDLNVLHELRFAATHHPDVPPETWVRATTLDAAIALGLSDDYGSLRPGKVANLVAIRLPAGQALDPWSWVFDATCEVDEVYVAGERFSPQSSP